MKKIRLLWLPPVLVCAAVAGCTSDQLGSSDNPHPRRTYNAESGNYQGPTPMPNPGANQNR
jgi:hypothetical protein